MIKALWQVGSISNSVEKSAAYHNIGWKIKDMNGNLARCDEIKRCMWVYFYLHQHILCGPDVFPDKSAAKIHKTGFDNSLLSVASWIEHSWNNIGPWVS